MLPHPRPEERALLQEAIKREGLRDPIVIWEETGAILDGNNRNEICDALKIKPVFRKVSLKNRQAAELWIITNQLGRRNLHPNHYAYFEGLRFERTKHPKGRPKEKCVKMTHLINGPTRERFAKESGRSARTIERNGAFARGVDLIESVKPGAKAEILNGSSQLTKGQIERVAKLAKEDPEKVKAAIKEAGQPKAKGEPNQLEQFLRENEKKEPQWPDVDSLDQVLRSIDKLATVPVERIRDYLARNPTGRRIQRDGAIQKAAKQLTIIAAQL